ncbi:MAG: hypothetical protein QOE23_546 [Pseudonocardiales bacterium]|nr:hypothetical protein [Pseudonocardiales bacterium]
MLAEDQQKPVLHGFDDTSTARPPIGSLPGLLLAAAAERPEEEAVTTDDDRLSFRALVEQSRRVAGCLRGQGLATEEPVGMFLQPSIDLVVGTWGVLFAGGAYLPLSPEYPEERLRYMIADSGVRVVLTQPELAARLAELSPAGTRVLTVSDARQWPDTDGPLPAPDHLAYVIYTSGSTGKPKGVLIEHRNVVNQLTWLRDACQVGVGHCVAQKTPMSFDAAQWEILACANGSRVAMATAGSYRDPNQLIELVQRHRVSVLQCVPTLLQALVDCPEFADCDSLRLLFSGGEALSTKLAASCLQALPASRLTNLYGPTECTINSSAFTVDAASLASGAKAVPIGRPVHNTQLYVLDGQLRPVPVGQCGEIYLGGAQVARGYLNRPDLTDQRFVPNPFATDTGSPKLYRSGDLGHWTADGNVYFLGRVDNQVKLRGYRIELDEIRVAIEAHTWVRNAAVVLHDDARTGAQRLSAFVQLNPREAALMDQGNAGAHHQSKASRLQVRAQLSNAGCREAAELAGRWTVPLPGRQASTAQRRRVFARKTYRFYDGGEVRRADLLELLDRTGMIVAPRPPDQLSLPELGALLRNFGQFESAERLLPKYGYASPGSLYATQLYLELAGVAGLPAGCYYYHPVRHELIAISSRPASSEPCFRLHFLGKRRAIEPVYRNNVSEVLEMEAGHMLGLFDEVLPEYGLAVFELGRLAGIPELLDCSPEDEYLGSFSIRGWAETGWADSLRFYLQAHPGRIADLPAGQYEYRDGTLVPVSEELVLRKHVIAINQQVYDRASFAITVLGGDGPSWLSYIRLGRALQRLQFNRLGIGLMSSGYSSHSGNDLPSARRITDILARAGAASGPSYFFVGGRVSAEQLASEGMGEDVVHMKGPAELIKDDLATVLPDFMLPNRVLVLDELPLTANGKVDVTSLAALAGQPDGLAGRPVIEPRTAVEHLVADIWRQELRLDAVSIKEDFFEIGGNSLIAVALVNRINRITGSALPLQVIFESPTIEQLAASVADRTTSVSRLVRLAGADGRPPIFCWPGLGGFTMNLRLLAERAGAGRPFYGIQAHGINPGERPYPSLSRMAAEDVAAIKRVQPDGPYSLWGYSFGARVAFETAYQLEQAGEQVRELVLIAPGSPRVGPGDLPAPATADLADPVYQTILFSVFAGTITGEALAECLRVGTDPESFATFVHGQYPALDRDLIQRIAAVVAQTYRFRYSAAELDQRRLDAPVTVIRARGDSPSFLEDSDWYRPGRATVLDLSADHYSTLKDPAIDELVTAIHLPARAPSETVMPHVNIKHFPVPLTDEQQGRLVSALTAAVRNAFDCDEGVISIALEPVEQEAWHERVYLPEIVNRKQLLHKVPNY